MRWLGAGLIVCISSIAGFGYAWRFTERCRLLREWERILEILKTEIYHQARLLPEVFRMIASITHEPGLKESFSKLAAQIGFGSPVEPSTAWRSLVDGSSHFVLTIDDLVILEELGDYLGATDREDQATKINAAQTRLEHNLQIAEREREKKVRFYRYLGFAVGATIVLGLM